MIVAHLSKEQWQQFVKELTANDAIKIEGQLFIKRESVLKGLAGEPLTTSDLIFDGPVSSFAICEDEQP